MTDWDHRQLCSDGACVGLIGPDGTCKLCGRAAANWGDERKRGMVAAHDDEESDDDDDDGYEAGDEYDDDDEDEDDDDEDDEPDDDDQGAHTTGDGEAGEWNQRKLCPDGACVGVVGADGKCKTCGSTAA